jgi:uncharacterized protein (TIGR01777 family)
VELAEWSPEKWGAWSRCVDGADAVVHLAGAAVLDEAWTHERKEELRSSRIRGAELLSEAIARAEKKPRVFISGSAIGYYGIQAADAVLNEESPPGDDFLAKLAVDWEDAAKGAAAAGVRVCHPRMGLVLGHGGMLEKMLPAFKAYVGGPVGTGAQYMSWIHIVDAVRALEYALDTDLSGPFNVTAPYPVTMDTFAHSLGSVLHRPSVVRVPPFAVELALGERSAAVLNGQRAIPERLDARGFAFVFPDVTSALADIVTKH